MLTADNFDVFISYSHRDVDWIKDWLLPRLESAGLRVCIDFRDFQIGVPSLDNMTDAAVRSRKTLFVMTPNWTVSEFSQFEALVTQTIDPIGRKGRLLPLMLKDCDLPARLQILTYADFRNPDNWDTELKRLIANIGESFTDESSTQSKAKLAPNLVHPYPLQANFTGRVNERKELTTWLEDDEHPIYELVAMGGMGKSALTWYWLTRDVLPSSDTKLDGVMWWSFQDVESSFAKFVDEALKYATAQPIDAEQLPATYDRAQELRRQVQNKRVLFLLDGFEWQLRAYARLDAAYQQDVIRDTSREARACVDPNAARLLPYLASGPTRAKVLLTTRLVVSNLEDGAGDPLVGVFQRELTGLPRDDAINFVRQQGVTKGTDTEIANVCAAYGNHPLSLRLLSGLIEHDAQMAGDIAAAPRVAARADFVAAQRQILEQSYDALPERERTLLSRIAAFRNPVTYNELAIFNEFGDDEKFDAGLFDLQARGLLQRDKPHNRYDLHPILRRYAYDRLSNKTSVHIRPRDYFAKIPVPDTNKVQSIEDLAPVIELYHHTVCAGRYDEARELLRDRLVPNPLHFRFGAYQLMIELERALFLDGDDHPPRLKDESAQGWTLNALAASYSYSGQPRKAMRACQTGNAIAERLSENKSLARGLTNIAEIQTQLGQLEAAEQSLNRGINVSREAKDEVWEAVGHYDLGRLLIYRGAFSGAESQLEIAKRVFDQYGAANTNFVSTVRADSAFRAVLMKNAPGALQLAQQARTLAEDVARLYGTFERDFIRAEWVLGAALVMEGKDWNAAAAHLAEALTRCRRISLVEEEPDILLAWARWHGAKGNASEAQAHADEALTIADRSEYRLKQAEIRNFLARLALDAGNREKAREHAEIAKERAWCDGPPHCYKPALDEAEKMLKELGAK